jgi:hypothetical protein
MAACLSAFLPGCDPSFCCISLDISSAQSYKESALLDLEQSIDLDLLDLFMSGKLFAHFPLVPVSHVDKIAIYNINLNTVTCMM